MLKKILILLFLLIVTSYGGEATLEKAQHRLPPVIYSIDIPKTVKANQTYDFKWTVMGYHDAYNIIINVYDKSGKRIGSKQVASYDETQGAYSWGKIKSTKYFYETEMSLNFSGSQELTIRFFASPPNDPINTTYLSCLVPGGSGYKAGDTTGRKILIDGITGDKNLSPIISDIKYNDIKFEQKSTFQINGNRLKNNLKFFIEDCVNIQNIYDADKTVRFQCTPSSTAGYKYGLIKNINTGDIIKEFTIFIHDDSSLSHYDYLQGIDVSHHQSYINWSQVANSGVKFAYIKATEGYLPLNTSESVLISKNALDSSFKENIQNSIANNVFSGLYHFARPDLNKGLSGAENEAKHFVRFAKHYYQNNEMLPPVVDVENPNNVNFKNIYNSSDLSAWIKKWLETVESELGIKPIVYTYGGYHSYLSGLNDYELWVARYPTNNGEFRTLDWFDIQYRPTSGSWKDWTIWQYTSSGANYVDGVNSKGLDRNVFRGTLNAMKQWAKDKKSNK